MMDARREYANAATAQICNLLAGNPPGGKSQLYNEIFTLIMNVMMLADEECAARWKEPSSN